MKKLVFFIGFFVINAANAWNSLNLDKQIVNCNNGNGSYSINNKTTASDIIANCKVTKQESAKYILQSDTEIQFDATITAPVRCEYNGGQLDQCKIVKE